MKNETTLEDVVVTVKKTSDIIPVFLPCPFCGHGDLIEIVGESSELGTIQYVASCMSCRAEGPWGKSEATARFNWNNRA